MRVESGRVWLGRRLYYDHPGLWTRWAALFGRGGDECGNTWVWARLPLLGGVYACLARTVQTAPLCHSFTGNFCVDCGQLAAHNTPVAEWPRCLSPRDWGDG